MERPLATGLARVFEGAFTHVLLLDADLQHLPQEASSLLAEAARSGADVVIGERRFQRSRMPASRCGNGNALKNRADR